MEFREFPKMARFSRDFIITEKIDGTNAQIDICNSASDEDDGKIINSIDGWNIRAGSKNKWIIPTDDNAGFANWVKKNSEELVKLGEGKHFGEWWGSGIQRGYGLQKGEKRFSLFNVVRWNTEERPICCSTVPILSVGNFDNVYANIENVLDNLRTNGSKASEGFMKPEGIIIWHMAANMGFKKTLEKDEIPKSLQNQ